MNRWKPGRLYLSLKAVNPHKWALAGIPPVRGQVASSLSSTEALQGWFYFSRFGRSYFSTPRLVVPMAKRRQLRPDTEVSRRLSKTNPSGSRLCFCPLRSHRWAAPDKVLAPDPLVRNAPMIAVYQVCSEVLVPGPDSVLICSRRLCMLFMFLQGNLLSCHPHLHLFISHTLY